MKLNEFTRDYQFDPKDTEAIGKYYKNRSKKSLKSILAQNGWKQVGSGLYSEVYAKAKFPYVLKANTKFDRAFAWFAMLTRKFPNIHFPRISNAKIYDVDNRRYIIYLVEKLEPYKGGDANDYADCMFELTRDFVNVEDGIEYYKDSSDVSQNALMKIENDLSMIEALQIIAEYKNDHDSDISASNIMQRKDGTVVIMDPLAY